MSTRVLSRFRPALVASVAALALPIGLLSAPADAAPDQPPVADRTAAGTMRIGTFNINAGLPLDRWVQAYSDFRGLVDVAGMQEVAGQDKNRAIEATPGWGSFRPSAFVQNPVFWNQDVFSLVNARAVKLNKPRRIEDKETHRLVRQPANLASVVRLRSKATGNTLSVINVHLLSYAVKIGKPHPGKKRRFHLYLDQVRNLAKLSKQEKQWSGGRVFALGDYNVNYLFEKKHRDKRFSFSRMRRAGLVAAWEARGHCCQVGDGSLVKGGSYLDTTWSARRASTIAVYRDDNFRVSDHWPVVSTYAMP